MFATQENSHKTKYGYVVLCDQDVHVGNPFAWYPRAIFSNAEIQEKWLNCILDHSSRLKPLGTLKQIPGKSFSLFGKIDEGRKKIV